MTFITDIVLIHTRLQSPPAICASFFTKSWYIHWGTSMNKIQVQYRNRRNGILDTWAQCTEMVSSSGNPCDDKVIILFCHCTLMGRLPHLAESVTAVCLLPDNQLGPDFAGQLLPMPRHARSGFPVPMTLGDLVNYLLYFLLTFLRLSF